MNSKKSDKIFISYYNSPIGLLFLQANKSKLETIEFVELRKYEEKINNILKITTLQLNEYFSGERFKFDLPLEFIGTNFQNKVWEALRQIHYGRTVSYKVIAERINHPKAYRGVGNANNKNKLPIVIPCHRVIGSKGQLTGYAGGIWRKKWLLEHEKKVSERKGI